MFILGGDQTVAMNTTHDTPLEAAMTAAFEAGAVVGGNSAGDAVQSRDMINGYYGANGPAESLRRNAVQVCFDSGPTDCEGGLAFGFPNLITDQHVFEYGRTGRSINVAVSTGKPVLGMDAATGAVVTDYVHLRDVTGDTLGYVVDPGAYGSSASYGGPNETLRTVTSRCTSCRPARASVRHDDAQPGRHAVAKPYLSAARTRCSRPRGRGPLFLGGGIVDDPAGLVGDAFTAAAGGSSARIVVLAAGYAMSGDAQADAKAIAAAFAPSVASVSWFALDSRTKTANAVAAIDGATGIIVTGQDRSLVLAQLQASPTWTAARSRWAGHGVALLADDAAAAAAGTVFVSEAPVADVEAAAIEDALNVPLSDGLGLVDGLAVTPRLLPDQHWPQALQLARAAGAHAVAAGIDVGTAIRIVGGSATVIGDSAVAVIDGRQATGRRARTVRSAAHGSSWTRSRTGTRSPPEGGSPTAHRPPSTSGLPAAGAPPAAAGGPREPHPARRAPRSPSRRGSCRRPTSTSWRAPRPARPMGAARRSASRPGLPVRDAHTNDLTGNTANNNRHVGFLVWFGSSHNASAGSTPGSRIERPRLR